VGGAEGKMKQFASWFTHGVPHGAQLRKAVYEAKTGTEILDAVDRFFEALLSAEQASPTPLLAGKNDAQAVPAYVLR
jgi:hypothetical protein